MTPSQYFDYYEEEETQEEIKPLGWGYYREVVMDVIRACPFPLDCFQYGWIKGALGDI